jgi:hypothetical protein
MATNIKAHPLALELDPLALVDVQWPQILKSNPLALEPNPLALNAIHAMAANIEAQSFSTGAQCLRTGT